MILTEFVEVKWGASNKNHLVSLGYEYTRRGDVLLVKVSDLSSRSSAKVTCSCDVCGKEQTRTYAGHAIAIKEYGTYRCSECGRRQRGGAHRVRSVDEVRALFTEAGLIPLFTTYTSRKKQLAYECQVHKGTVQYKTLSNFMHSTKKLCPLCSVERRAGSGNYNWLGGVSLISSYLRKKLRPWVLDSLHAYGFTCAVTGKNSGDLQAHQVKPFRDILVETLIELSLLAMPVQDYTPDELQELEELILKKHYEYGLGVPLQKALHKEFHSRYGIIGFTRENLDEFIKEKQMLLKCPNPECGAATYDQIAVYNDGMSPPSAECKVCHTTWGGKQSIMVKGELPGPKDLPLKENKDMSPRTA